MRKLIGLILLPMLLTTCVEPYVPSVIAINPDYLVIDAFLDPTGNVTVNVFHTIALNSGDEPAAEVGATITIEDETGYKAPLYGDGTGRYVLAGTQFSPDGQYRLNVRTTRNREYQSEFIPVKISPAIDSINWTIFNGNLEINITTHDDSGESGYYMWNCTETFEYLAPFPSSYVIQEDLTVIPRPGPLAIDKCWKTDPLYDIFVGTSSALGEDVISSFKLRAIASNDVRLSRKYSILVKQIVLTEQGYNYWSQIKKTTESLGGLFDPLPGQVVGNIKCISDPLEPVIGFFSASTVQERRIFISSKDLPEEFLSYDPPNCQIDTLLPKFITRQTDPDIIIAPAYVIYPGAPPIFAGWLKSTTRCTDCRDYQPGGVTEKPAFWD
jgi:hypothetical protein